MEHYSALKRKELLIHTIGYKKHCGERKKPDSNGYIMYEPSVWHYEKGKLIDQWLLGTGGKEEVDCKVTGGNFGG